MGTIISTPRESPAHQENQLAAKRSRETMPSSAKPLTESVALTRAMTGARSMKRSTSKPWSKGAG